MNLGEAKNRVLKIMREYSNAGVVTPVSRNKDYTLSMNSLFDVGQKEIATTTKPIYKNFDISQLGLSNGLGRDVGWKIEQHKTEDRIFTINSGALSYYFEIDNTADVFIEEETSPDVWTILETHNYVATAREYTTFKNLIVPSDTDNAIRLRFSGDFFYNFKNYALFIENFALVADVPNYEPFVEYILPTDFYNIKDVVWEYNIGKYTQYGAYRFERKDENRRSIMIPYHDTGEFRVKYNAYPTTIDDDTLDTHEFDLDDEAQEVLLYYVASGLKKDEDPNMSDRLQNDYNIKMNNLMEAGESQGLHIIYDAEGWN